MKKLLNFYFLTLLTLFLSIRSFSQYILNGSARQNTCNCYTLTTEVMFDSGSVWNANKINLENSFDFHFNAYLGCLDFSGADGIVFILQRVTGQVGRAGEGLGFEGVSPSVGISLDTWQNFNRNDPWFDHISIQLNGNITHGNDLAGPVQAVIGNANIEDCNWHVFRITWDASTKTLATYLDGQFRLQAQIDLVASVFNNDPMVYWGFSGATGGEYNVQKFCTALNPAFTTNLTDSSTCVGNPVVFTDQSESFTTIEDFYWDFGDGTTSTAQNPPAHSYSPGAYIVKHVITGQDGCASDTLRKTINIGAKPVANFSLFDTCTNKILGIKDLSTSAFGELSQWTWLLDGSVYSGNPQPGFADLSLSSHQLKLAVDNIYGCMSDTVTKDFSVHVTPVVTINSPFDGCWKQPVSFSGQQIDNATRITEWNWKFDDGALSHGQSTAHVYSRGGQKTVHLTVFADDRCFSNDTSKQINIEDIYLDAGKDTSVRSNTPFMLHASWSGNFTGLPGITWSPSTGLSSIGSYDPTSILENDQRYYLVAITDAGCIARDSVKINIFNFPGVLVPSAFTPNHDGLNDILKPRYNGIKRLDYFSIYNRWGQLVFRTSDKEKGWDGNLNGQPQGVQTFVWIVNAEDFDGRKYALRGTTTIIR